MSKQFAIVKIANHWTPVELVGEPTIKVRPLDGHLGDGIEPEMAIPYANLNVEGIANIGGRTIPVQAVGEPTVKVRPIDGHLGDCREPEVEVDWLRILVVANENEATQIADNTNSRIKEVKVS